MYSEQGRNGTSSAEQDSRESGEKVIIFLLVGGFNPSEKYESVGVTIPNISHMLHVWYIYLHDWVILFGQMLVNIPAPWTLWVIGHR